MSVISYTESSFGAYAIVESDVNYVNVFGREPTEVYVDLAMDMEQAKKRLGYLKALRMTSEFFTIGK